MNLIEQMFSLLSLANKPKTIAKVKPAERHGAKLAAKRYWEKRAKNDKMPECSVMTRQRRRAEERTTNKAAWRKKRAERVALRKSAA